MNTLSAYQLFIRGDNDCLLSINNIEFKKWYFEATFQIITSWYSAKVIFSFSYEEWYEFVQQVILIINSNQGDACFISENCAIELNLRLDNSRGHVYINGILTNNNLEDDSRLEYYMQSDYWSLQKFKNSLEFLIENMKQVVDKVY